MVVTDTEKLYLIFLRKDYKLLNYLPALIYILSIICGIYINRKIN